MFAVRAEWLDALVEATERGTVTLTTLAEIIVESIDCDHALYVELDFVAANVLMQDLILGHRFTNGGILVTKRGMNPVTTSYFGNPGDLTPRRTSDVTTQRTWESTAAYAEVYRPIRGRFQLFMITSLHAPSSGRGWCLTRSVSDFSANDVETATALLPMLAVMTNRLTMGGSVAATPPMLTARERLVLAQLARGWTTGHIGYELSISRRTVEKHLEHVYRKLGVNDRILATERATHLHLI
jgi:DNA-binding CsgD family transcriptional regulator